jgi:choline dehydrogenase-like flavoprotein
VGLSAFLSHPFDAWLMVQAAKHARKIMAQPQFQKVVLNEQFPGPSVQSDDEWLESVKNRVRTECESSRLLQTV